MDDPWTEYTTREINLSERPERNKPEHRFPGQGPLSSIRAVIKRTSRTTSHGDQQRDRRRPEITIVAAEPIGPGSWFHGGPPGGFPPPPPPQWRPSETHPAEPPSYEQVIKEINQVQVTTTSSNAEPRRTTTCATQTDFPEEEDRNLPGNILINQPVSCEQEAASVQSSTEISRLSNNVKNYSPQIACVNITDTTVRQEDPNVLRLPVPRPRTKSNIRPVGNHLSIFHLLASTENHTGFGDHSFEETVEINNMSHERSQNLIGSRIRAFESQSEKSDQCRRPEIAPRSINTKNSVTVKPIPPPKPLSNRISGEWDAAKDNKPKAPPREGLLPPKTQDTGNATKPDLPKKPKPPLLSGSSNGGDINDGISETSLFGNNSKETERKIPVPAPRPMVPKKSVQTDNSALPTALPRPVVSAPAPKLSIAAQSKTFTTTETPAARSFAPLAHSKSAGEVVDLISFEDDNVLSPVILPSPESTSDSKANYDPFQLFSKDETEKELPTNSAPLRKPTIIRISGKLTKSSEELQIPPPLPAEKPVGSLFEKTSAKSRPAGKKEREQSECTEDTRSKPVLPTRPIGVKVMETQVPATKGPPGRPPPPKVSKTGASRDAFPRASSDISLSTKQNVSVLNRSKSQVLKRQQPELPPRPKPGHPLYNKYMLPVPHGIAEKDVVSKNPGELSCKRGDVLVLLEQTDNNSLNCQRGSATGEVKVSNIKIITPLDESLDTTQKDNNVPRALVLHDFTGGDVDDLSLNAGETVYLLEKIDNEWYKGKCKSCTGIFPSNHVRVLVDVPDKVTQKNITFNSVTKGPRCKARFEFSGDQTDELSFSEGDLIVLREYVNEEWAKGELNGHVGIFPINFVEIIEDLPMCGSNQIAIEAANSQKNKMSGQGSQYIESSGEWCDALYDFAAESEEDLSFKKGDKILIVERLDKEWYKGRLNGKEGILPVAFVHLCSGSKPLQTQGGNPGKAQALYAFCGESEDELSFKAGDLILAVESVDSEWMSGELKGRRGIFPKNFVQEC